ncbi:MAG: hypothetical protein WCO00_09220 [Rhodospirillaceae bacterium]
MQPPSFPSAEAFGSSRSSALDFALGMVRLMADSGQISLPAKPTPAMLAAGAKAGGVSVIVAWKIYHAMVEAA